MAAPAFIPQASFCSAALAAMQTQMQECEAALKAELDKPDRNPEVIALLRTRSLILLDGQLEMLALMPSIRSSESGAALEGAGKNKRRRDEAAVTEEDSKDESSSRSRAKKTRVLSPRESSPAEAPARAALAQSSQTVFSQNPPSREECLRWIAQVNGSNGCIIQ